jgi:hypothetical protein
MLETINNEPTLLTAPLGRIWVADIARLELEGWDRRRMLESTPESWQ